MVFREPYQLTICRAFSPFNKVLLQNGVYDKPLPVIDSDIINFKMDREGQHLDSIFHLFGTRVDLLKALQGLVQAKADAGDHRFKSTYGQVLINH